MNLRTLKTRWKTSGVLPNFSLLLSGILFVLAFPPWNLHYLIFVCYIPWLISLKKGPQTYKRYFWHGVQLSFFIAMIGFYWVAYVLKEFAFMPWSISILGLVGFGFICQPQLGFFSLALRYFRPKKFDLKMGLFIGLAYTGIDWLIPKLFVDSMGYAFYQAKYLRQLADLGGVSLLTFLAFYVNLSLSEWIFEVSQFKKKHYRISSSLLCSAFLLTLALFYGHNRYHLIQDLLAKPHPKAQIAAIQANIGDFEKLAAENGVRGAGMQVIQTFIGLSHQALALDPKPEALVWPETAYPQIFGNPTTLTEQKLETLIRDFSSLKNIPLYFGGYDHKNGKDFNSFFFLSPAASNPTQIYHKSILLMFGEYIPLAENIPWVREKFPQVGYFGRGEGASVLEVPIHNNELKTIRVAPIICYEALFPQYTIDSANQGSQLILNITNDSWFGKWGEPQLHLALTTFRSIETRVPQLRSTNTGISTLIMPDGEITQPTEIGVQAIVNATVPILEPIPTLVKKWGNWFGLFALGLCGLASFLWLPKYRRAK